MGNKRIDKLILGVIAEVDLKLTQSCRAAAHVEQELLTFLRDTDILHPKRKVSKSLDSPDPHLPVETALQDGADRIVELIRMARHSADRPIAPRT